MDLFKNGIGIEGVIKTIQDTEELSYNLRSKLNTILGFSDILEDSASSRLSGSQVDAIKKIRRDSHALSELLAETLNLSKAGAALAREMALSGERIRNNQSMIRAVWAAMALLIGWSLMSHQFAVNAAGDTVRSKIEVVHILLESIEVKLATGSKALHTHMDSGSHDR